MTKPSISNQISATTIFESLEERLNRHPDICPAVLWRKCSYGSQSTEGSLFVGRMMTVVSSLRRQQRHVLDYLSEACRSKRLGLSAPSLLPISTPANPLPVP